jgi:Family of unknown function (DUF6502)
MGGVNIKHSLLEAYRRIFRPLVRVLLRNGVSFSDFSDASREVFIEECIKDSWRRGGDSSVARVAVMSGLPRRTVEQIVNSWSEEGVDNDKTRAARVARILTGWSTDPRYVGPYGWPIDVPLEPASATRTQSFEELVKRYGGNVSPQVMLDELLHVNAVRKTESGLLRLENRAYIPEALTDESLNRLSAVVSNVVQTLDHNMQAENEAEGLFERTVSADHGLSARQLPQLDTFLRERGPEFLEALDAWMSAHPPGADEERLNVGVGVYMFVEHEPDRLNPAEFGLRNPKLERV